MSFWCLSYFRFDDPYGSGIEAIYKTQDEAILEAISSSYGKLIQTPDGIIWYYEEDMDKPIKLEKLKERIRKCGFFDLRKPRNNFDIGEASRYYTIRERKLSIGSEIAPRKVNTVEGRKKCCQCEKKVWVINILQKFEWGFWCHKCRKILMTGSIDPQLLQSFKEMRKAERKMKVKLRKKSRRSTERVYKMCGMELYPDPGDDKNKVIRMKNGVILIICDKIKKTVGSDIENDKKLKPLTDDQTLWATATGTVIDQTWRKGNNDPIPWSDYLKMASQEKN